MRHSLILCLALAACSQRDDTPPPPPQAPAAPAAPEAPVAPEAPLAPPAPGTPGGLPDDRTPLSEGPIAPKSAQGAGQILQTYFALVEEKKYAEAYRLWSDSGRASNMSAAQFADSFEAYREYHANIGAPGLPEGAAGSIYVDIPVQIYGRMADGKEFSRRGTASLRRVNDVDGATAEQLQWRIFKIDA